MSHPTEKYTVHDPGRAVDEITAFLEQLAADGKEPRCEVRYPAPEWADEAEWTDHQEESFDAVELVDGKLRTLPPYSELEAS